MIKGEITMERTLFWNTDGKTTVVYEYDHEFDGLNEIVKRYPWVDVDWLADQSRFVGKGKVIGRAVLHPEDTYSEEKGRQMAIRALNRNIAQQRKQILADFERLILNNITSNVTTRKAKTLKDREKAMKKYSTEK